MSAISRTGSTTPWLRRSAPSSATGRWATAAAKAAALCALSELIWCPGRIAASERASRDALEALEGLEPGREAALAYLNLAVVAKQTDDAVALAQRACALAEELGDPQMQLRARIEVDSQRAYRGGESRLALEETLRRAMAAGYDSEACSIWVRLAHIAHLQRAYAEVDRYAEAGLAFCGERDLEIYARYLHAYRAQAALERARWGEAGDAAAIVLHDPGPSVIPLLRALVAAAMARARQGEPGSGELLERAAARAAHQEFLDMTDMVTAARAEAAWLQGKRGEMAGLTDAPFEHAVARRAWRQASELARWRRRAGLHDRVQGADGPDAAALAGDWERAAQLWAEAGCPYEAALALCDADDENAARRGVSELRRIGARQAAVAATQRLRERGVRRVPRGPNASRGRTGRTSRRASSRCWSSSRKARGTPRSPSASWSRGGRSTTTFRHSCASSRCARAAKRRPSPCAKA